MHGETLKMFNDYLFMFFDHASRYISVLKTPTIYPQLFSSIVGPVAQSV
jgi:hypothetical protein